MTLSRGILLRDLPSHRSLSLDYAVGLLLSLLLLAYLAYGS